MPDISPAPRKRESTSKLRPSDLSTNIVETLKRELGEGRYGPDTSFTEVALSERFGVSRTPVREALLILERDGLLVPLERGFGLPKYTHQHMTDLFVVRQQLEPYVIRRIVETSGAKKLDEFVKMARETLSQANSAESYIHANRSIRLGLLALCPNHFIREAIELFHQQTAYIRQQTLRDHETRALSIKLNHRLVDAIAARDSSAAEAAYLAILDAAHAAITRVLSTPPYRMTNTG